MGLWIEQTEGAKFWLKVLDEIKNRCLDDVLIAVVDGLRVKQAANQFAIMFGECFTPRLPTKKSRPRTQNFYRFHALRVRRRIVHLPKIVTSSARPLTSCMNHDCAVNGRAEVPITDC